MLCPEVWNFPAPKVMTTLKKGQNFESLTNTIKMVNFYKSVVVTCPDELQTPSSVEEILLADTDYYKVSNCPLTEFLEPTFIEKFVKNGNLYCLSADRNCLVHNCAAITPNGVLTLHIPEYIFQTLGLEGIKRPHNFYEVTIDLKHLQKPDRVKYALKVIDDLETLDFHILWEPNSENICPSSIAKYFNDRNLAVSLCTLEVTKLTPTVTEIPSIKDVCPAEMVEWVGLLALDIDMSETDSYISTYSAPESEFALKTSRISILIVKGLIIPTNIIKACKNLEEYVLSRELDNLWSSVSAQSCEESIMKCSSGSPMMFQSHSLSCNIFFERSGHTVYSVGHLKYT